MPDQNKFIVPIWGTTPEQASADILPSIELPLNEFEEMMIDDPEEEETSQSHRARAPSRSLSPDPEAPVIPNRQRQAAQDPFEEFTVDLSPELGLSNNSQPILSPAVEAIVFQQRHQRAVQFPFGIPNDPMDGLTTNLEHGLNIAPPQPETINPSVLEQPDPRPPAWSPFMAYASAEAVPFETLRFIEHGITIQNQSLVTVLAVLHSHGIRLSLKTLIAVVKTLQKLVEAAMLKHPDPEAMPSQYTRVLGAYRCTTPDTLRFMGAKLEEMVADLDGGM